MQIMSELGINQKLMLVRGGAENGSDQQMMSFDSSRSSNVNRMNTQQDMFQPRSMKSNSDLMDSYLLSQRIPIAQLNQFPYYEAV